MKRKIIVFCSIIILSVSAIIFLFKYFGIDIEMHDYTFEGRNELWTANYTANSKGYYYKKRNRLVFEGNYESTFELVYKGDLSELSAIKKVEYKLSTGQGGAIESDGLKNRKVFSGKSAGTGMKIIHDEFIELTVIVDNDKTETIKMHKFK